MMKKKAMNQFNIKKKAMSLVWSTVIAAVISLLVIVPVWYFSAGVDKQSDYVVCKNSINMRESIPDIKGTDSKNIPKLRCETEYVSIDFQDVTRAQKLVLDKMAECWNLVNRGQVKNIFTPANTREGRSTHCLTCAVIHVDDKVKPYYQSLGGIDIRNPLYSMRYDLGEGKSTQYYSYLNQRCDEWGVGFDVEQVSVNGNKQVKMTCPDKIYPQLGNGDLFITLVTLEGVRDKYFALSPGISEPPQMSLIFYQPTPPSFLALKKNVIATSEVAGTDWSLSNTGYCENFETIA